MVGGTCWTSRASCAHTTLDFEPLTNAAFQGLMRPKG